MNAPVINIEDSDYALFYRELSENTDSFDGKTVTFLGQVKKDGRPLGSGFLIGRPIMTCCVQDITFGGLFCEDGGEKFRDGDWVRLTAPMTVKYCRVYGRPGPVLKLGRAEKAEAPTNPVATFY